MCSPAVLSCHFLSFLLFFYAQTMNFSFDVRLLLSDEVNRIVGSDLTETNRTSKYWRDSGDFSVSPGGLLWHLIDCMGHLSAKAQGLQHKITSGEKLKDSDHVLYIMTDDQSTKTTKVVGILKMGYKKLFLQDHRGVLHERTPPCVLDFYVHESCQRVGYGKRLFEFMLRDLKVAAHELAIDRPSRNFLSFLSRHYHLTQPVHQGNRFTVFEEMFADGGVATPRLRHVEHPNTIGNRQSYPPSAVNNRNRTEDSPRISRQQQAPVAINSVADVVFGQYISDVTQRNNSYVEQCTNNLERMTRGNGGIVELRPATDSSFNIFGIPSPDYGRGAYCTHR